MSQMIWQKLLVPGADAPKTVLRDESYNEIVENVCFHPWASNQIPIPDAKAFRSMTRAALFLTYVSYEAREVLAPYLARSPFSVGIYCAVENGPIDAASTLKIIGPDGEPKLGFAEAYRKFRNPKMYLKQLPNLAPAQMGIFMGLQGPMNVYTHSTHGAYQALEQAEWDLANGVVEAALVCSAHAFDDFVLVRRSRKVDPRCLVEGAGALVLVASSSETPKFTKWTEKIREDKNNFYGIANPIVNFLKEEENATTN